MHRQEWKIKENIRSMETNYKTVEGILQQQKPHSIQIRKQSMA